MRRERRPAEDRGGELTAGDGKRDGVVEVMQAALLGDFAQAFARGRKIIAEQTRLREHLLQTIAPKLGARAETIQDASDFARDAGLALPHQTASVIDQQQVTAERKAFEHPFALRSLPPRVLYIYKDMYNTSATSLPR